jgi:hypothetical protein
MCLCHTNAYDVRRLGKNFFLCLEDNISFFGEDLDASLAIGSAFELDES